MFRVEGLLGELRKHRDYEHETFYDHERANGAWENLDRSKPIKVKYNPITERLLSPSEKYYFLDFGMHTGQEYTFLIPAEADGSTPNKNTIRDQINDTVSSPISGGRDWFNYLDLDDVATANHPRVLERLDAGDRQENPRLRRKSPYYSFWDEQEEFDAENY